MIFCSTMLRRVLPGAAPRLLLAGMALTCVSALAAGCGSSGSPAAAPTKTIIVKATPAASASTTAGTSATAAAPAASPTVAGAAPACPTRSLGLKIGLGQGAAGSTFQVIDFTNISNTTCTLYGYPGVSLAGGSPVKQIGVAAGESHTTARKLVTLSPGAVANAVVQIVHAVNFPVGKCGLVTAHYLQIYPPNQTTPAYLHYTAQTCSKPVRILTVSVVQPGSGGQ